jgi:glycosyltransferase involved in cell wall biosynthesis
MVAVENGTSSSRKLARGAGRLLVVGGGGVSGACGDEWYAPTPVANYMNDLATYFGETTWLIRKVPPSSTQFEGRLDSTRIRVLPYSASRAARLVLWLRFLQLARHHTHALLNFPASVPLLFAMPIARRYLQSMVVYLGIDHRYWSTRTRSAQIPVSPWLFHLAHEYPMRIADAVIVRGRFLSSIVADLNSHVIETYPLGSMDLNIKRDRSAEDRGASRRILFIGRIVRFKGLQDLLEAIRLVMGDNQAIYLDIVGDGPDREAIDAWRRELHLEDRIHLHGYVDNRTSLSRLFEQADVLVVPSTDSEGVPRVIDEALAAGLPVIATNVGGIAEEFTNGELMLIEPRNPALMAQAIITMLFDEEQRTRYLNGARARQAKWAQYTGAAHQHAEVLLSAGMMVSGRQTD